MVSLLADELGVEAKATASRQVLAARRQFLGGCDDLLREVSHNALHLRFSLPASRAAARPLRVMILSFADDSADLWKSLAPAGKVSCGTGSIVAAGAHHDD